ncbi:DUF3108 domain-containing protein [Neptunicoccus cionae]|uniref:DUF3108 domain-containing protein n=1 Tax=Neptunicoccus cionae TaxID=2035344 RepID=A0A916QU00_9RHOB|nr:DUF3108 domain-containing protein [Amylibacter cionae]GGA13587.1 hypothetical protein GCM10011498_12020 [Amylibacter cionae]
MRLLLTTLALLNSTGFTYAGDIDQTFGFYVAGLKAGTIRLIGTEPALGEDGPYTLHGTLTPTSIMRRFHDVGYDGRVDGAVSDGQFVPQNYEGQSRSESRQTDVQLTYKDSRPQVVRYAPERGSHPYDIDPAAQNDAVDPLTAAHMLLRDQRGADLCDRTLDLFDGRRLSRLEVDAPIHNGAKAICEGRYTRVAGFSPEDMQEQVNFPITLVYIKGDADLYTLSFFKTDTTFGPAEAARR